MTRELLNGSYAFERGFPTAETAQKAYDDTDLIRAIEAYRFFYPTVSGSATLQRQREDRNHSQQGFLGRWTPSRNTSASPSIPTPHTRL